MGDRSRPLDISDSPCDPPEDFIPIVYRKIRIIFI